MKKFINNSILFLLPLLIAFLLFELNLRAANKPNIYTYKNNLLNSCYDAIVLGNSHALRGVIAEEIKVNTINLANVSQTLDIDIKWLEKVLSKNKIKLVILNYTIPTLTKRLSNSKERWRLKNYNIYTSLQLNLWPKDNSELLNGRIKDNFNILRNFVVEDSIPSLQCYSKGSYPLSVAFSDFEKHAEVAANRHIGSTSFIEENKKITVDIINLTQKHNCKLLILTPPAHYKYREALPQELKAHLFNFLNSISEANSHVTYVNYFGDSVYKNHHFKDSDHLNLQGAMLFTQTIDSLIMSSKLYQ